MTPEQEAKIDAIAAQQVQVLAALHTLQTLVLRYEQQAAETSRRIERLERSVAWLRRGFDTLRQWVLRLWSGPPTDGAAKARETLPSLSSLAADGDSGSLEVSVLGSGAKFVGPAGLAIARWVLLVAALVGAGVFGAWALGVHR